MMYYLYWKLKTKRLFKLKMFNEVRIWTASKRLCRDSARGTCFRARIDAFYHVEYLFHRPGKRLCHYLWFHYTWKYWSGVFSLLICLYITNLNCEVSLLFWIGFSRNVGQNHYPRMQKLHFRFTCVDRSKTSLLKFPNNRSCYSDLRLGCMAIWEGGRCVKMGYLEREGLVHKNRRSRIQISQLTFKAPCCNQIRIIYFLKVSVNQSTNQGNKRDLGTDQQQHTFFPDVLTIL